MGAKVGRILQFYNWTNYNFTIGQLDEITIVSKKNVYLCGMRLSIENLSIGYGDHTVQQGLRLHADTGQMICLLGTNGCGKSTLLRTIASLQRPIDGQIYLCDQEIGSLSAQERSRLLALVLTERIAIANTHVSDIVAMGRYPYSGVLGRLNDEDQQRIQEAMQQTEIGSLKGRYFNSLSDGEKQRVLLAKAVAQQTPIILLDEPTAHLDLPGRYKTFELLQELAHTQEKTILISTHDLDLALQTADVLWLMKPNKGVVVGSPKELLQTNVFEELFGEQVRNLTQRFV